MRIAVSAFLGVKHGFPIELLPKVQDVIVVRRNQYQMCKTTSTWTRYDQYFTVYRVNVNPETSRTHSWLVGRRCWCVVSRECDAIRRRSMAQNRCRKDIVGKRFLCVSSNSINGGGQSSSPIKSAIHQQQQRTTQNEPARWAWRAGVIRAATHHNTDQHDLQVWFCSEITFFVV